ncbi:MAG TPA: DUF4863 family protein [Candidatus Competibacteraceae bacterium]|nr:DUF4863 family protein [Candidatus Competibacteraceae bacterium]
MTPQAFEALITRVTETIAGRPLDAALGMFLNETFPPDEETFKAIERACHEAIAEGWMCNREAGGIRFGRVVKPGPSTHGFSVDVVLMKDVKGPHHRHPNGEIDMIMPLTPEAQFDGHGSGWFVYAPDSAHCPTVTQGEAIVLYLLPEGAIEFTKA